MKPSFALQFTQTGITLLHRTGRGWLPLGDAAIDDPALGDNLGYLRATALGLEPQGITTKLVIPNDQILYIKVEAPGPDAVKRRNQIRRALEGRTPYAVDDLAFDWSGTGPEVLVAVIARETLAEAEAFAASHRFNPMSFVALPDPGSFDGEPFFGPSSHATTALSPGDKVERDRAGMRIIGRGDAGRTDAGRSDAARTEAGRTEAGRTEAGRTEAGRTGAGRNSATTAAGTEQELPLSAPEPQSRPDLQPPRHHDAGGEAGAGIGEPLVAEPPAALPDIPTHVVADLVAAEPVVAHSAAPTGPAAIPVSDFAADLDPQATSLTAGTAADLDLLEDADADLSVSTPVAHPLTEPTPARFDLAFAVAEVPEAPAMFDVPMDDGDIPAMPHAGAAATFSSRRNGVASRLDETGAEPMAQPRLGPGVQASSITSPSLPGNGPAETGAVSSAPPAAPPPMRSATKPQPNGKVADPRGKLAAAGKTGGQQGAIARYVPMKGKGGSSGLANAATRAGTTPPAAESAVGFTKRTLGATPARRGKPRYLGLILTVILLLFLAAVALWSSYFVGDTALEPAADTATATPASDADAALDPEAQDPLLVPGATADDATSGTLIEPPEADATAEAEAATEPATEAAAADPIADPVAEPGAEPGAEPAPQPVADATLSTSDQVATGEPAAANPEAATAEIVTGGSATPEAATAGLVPPVPEATTTEAATTEATTADAATAEAATAETSAADAATAETGPAAVDAAEPVATVAQTPAAEAPAAEAPAAEPPAAEPPAAEPPAAAPQADTEFAALTNGQLQDAGASLPELVGTDSGLQTGAAAILAPPQTLAGDSRPETPLPPAPFGTFFERDPNGFVIATPEGAVTPEGALVIAGRPVLVPPPRPGGTADPATTDPSGISAAAADPVAAPPPEQPALQSDPALAGFRPKPRPPAPVDSQDDTALQVEPQIATAATARPPARPATSTNPDVAATTADAGVDAATLTSATNLAVAASRRPAQRPADLAASVSAALATVEPEPQPAVAAPEQQPVLEAALAPAPRPAKPVVAEPAPEPEAAAPEADNEPETASAAPAIPQNASVAKQATLANAINLGKLNLIGVYGTANNRHALVRLASGRYVRVKVGDRVDGGQVAAIGEQELRYIKNGRNLVLSLPKDS